MSECPYCGREIEVKAEFSLVGTDNAIKDKVQDQSQVQDQNQKKRTKNKSRGNFSPPTLQDVADYCKQRKNNVDPEAWWNWYASINWMVGKNRMVDWRAAVITWEKRNREQPLNEPKKRECDQEKCNLEGKYPHYGRWFCRAHLPL